MTPEEAVQLVETKFPFVDYATRSDRQSHFLWVARRVAEVLPKGAAVLDFGSGPADVSAVLAQTGYRVTAADDLQDTWHLLPGNRDKILNFARELSVEFEITDRATPWPWKPGQFDMIMLHHVLEHLADSPRGLLLALLDLVKPGGYLFVTVPNLVNLRKRLSVARGRSNLPPYGQYFWSEGSWRGHSREYTEGDLRAMAEFLSLDVVSLDSYHLMLTQLPASLRGLWKVVTKAAPGWRDSWSLIARKREPWNPRRHLTQNDPDYKRHGSPLWC